MVYHFTSLEKFESILKSIPAPNGRHLTLWASRIYELNDPLEMVFGTPIVMDAIKTFEEENEIAEEYKLSTYQEYAMRIGKTIDDATYISHIKSFQYAPYELSFCRINEDKIKNELPLWIAYGSSGEGICLGFDERLFNLTGNSDFKYLASNVVYLIDNVEERPRNMITISLLRPFFHEKYKEYLEKSTALVKKIYGKRKETQ